MRTPELSLDHIQNLLLLFYLATIYTLRRCHVARSHQNLLLQQWQRMTVHGRLSFESLVAQGPKT